MKIYYYDPINMRIESIMSLIIYFDISSLKYHLMMTSGFLKVKVCIRYFYQLVGNLTRIR